MHQVCYKRHLCFTPRSCLGMWELQDTRCSQLSTRPLGVASALLLTGRVGLHLCADCIYTESHVCIISEYGGRSCHSHEPCSIVHLHAVLSVWWYTSDMFAMKHARQWHHADKGVLLSRPQLSGCCMCSMSCSLGHVYRKQDVCVALQLFQSLVAVAALVVITYLGCNGHGNDTFYLSVYVSIQLWRVAQLLLVVTPTVLAVATSIKCTDSEVWYSCLLGY